MADPANPQTPIGGTFVDGTPQIQGDATPLPDSVVNPPPPVPPAPVPPAPPPIPPTPTPAPFIPSLPNNPPADSSGGVTKESTVVRKHHSKLLLIILLIILVLGGISIGIYYFLNKNKENNPILSSSRTISSQEWQQVVESSRTSFTAQSMKPLLGTAIKNNSESTAGVKSYYENIGEAVGVNPQEEATQSTGNIPFIQKFQFGLKISGEQVNQLDGEQIPFSGSLAYLMLVDKQLKQSQTDLILNGVFGDLVLNDSDMDALHISFIQPSETKTLVNVEASDYMMILLNPVNNQESSGIIDVDTNNIYPYFGNYVELNSEEQLGESMVKEGAPRVDRGPLETAFSETIGNFDSYLVPEQNRQLTAGPSELGLIMVQIDKGKFIQAISDYFDKVGEFSEENKDKFMKRCQNADENCLRQEGYMSESETQEAKAGIAIFMAMLEFEKAGIIVEPESLSFRGIAMDLKQSDNFLVNDSMPFSNLAISISYYSVVPDENVTIFQPTTSISPEVVPSAESNGTADQANRLYADNRAYMQTLKMGLWEAITSSSDSYCNLYWTPKFCIQRPADWNISDPEFEGDYIRMSYPYGYVDSNQARIQINITPLGDLQGYNLDTESDANGNTPEIRNVTTSQGVRLGLVSRGGGGEGYWFSDVGIYSKGVYNNMLPFGMIGISAKGIQPEEVFDRIEAWLKTMTIETEIMPEWIEDPPPIFPSGDYPEKKQTMKIEPTQTIKDQKLVDVKMLVVNNADPDSEISCITSNNYIYSSYGVDEQEIFYAMFPNSQPACFSDTLCLVCKNGVWEEEGDLTACRGLRCYPN